jgi:hypothetical protein
LIFLGSFAFDLGHYESDIDFAFVADTQEDLCALQKTIAGLITGNMLFKGCKFPMGLNFKTKLGLPWIPVEGFWVSAVEKVMKLNITFRTSKQHSQICEIMIKGVSKLFEKDDDAKLKYITTLELLTTIKRLSKLVPQSDNIVDNVKTVYNQAEQACTTTKSWFKLEQLEKA